MSDNIDDYTVFLDNWASGPRLEHALLPQQLADPLSRARLFDDSSAQAPLERAVVVRGKRAMSEEELRVRRFSFFKQRRRAWVAEFQDYVRFRGVSAKMLRIYNESFARKWVDGRGPRQKSPEMMAIRASIRAYDLEFHPRLEESFVVYPVDSTVEPLFEPREMAVIFEANNGLIDAFLPNYTDLLGEEGPGVISDLYVRRGVYMPEAPSIRRELSELSSYSLTLGPVEQFAQTHTPKTEGKGLPTIFSALLPAVQDRIVAFAPFVKGMDLGQLELVVAPPLRRTLLIDDGEHGGIRELRFI